MIRKLIRCTACNQVIPNYEGYELARDESLPGVEWSNMDLIRAKDFLRTHLGHPLEELSVEVGSWISEKPSYEPMRVTYFYASNDEQEFLIQRTKTALDQPVSYEIIPGRLQIVNVSLNIQEDDLRKQIAADSGFSLMAKEKVERFIQIFKKEVAGISLEELDREVESIQEGETSLQVYGKLAENRWAWIIAGCRRYFEESELKEIIRFVDENQNPPGVLSLQIQRRISIISLAAKGTGGSLKERKEKEAVLENHLSSITEKKVVKKDL